MAIPNVNPKNIIEAMQRFDDDETISRELGNWQESKAYKFAIRNGDQLYPVKTIISLATGLDVSQFSGGPESIRYLQNLGFSVEPLRLPNTGETMAALHDLLLLRFPASVQPSEAYETLAEEFGLSTTQRTAMMPRSPERHWENRVRQARRKLVAEGTLDGTERGAWKLRLRSGPRVFIEKCRVEGRDDRQAGENALGKALWSPLRRIDGADIYHTMRRIQPGDKIIHLIDNQRISGISIAADVARPNFVGVTGTDWEGQPSYRVSLQAYEPLDPPIERGDFFDAAEPRRELVRILSNHSGLFYTRDLDLNQGAYLTEAPSPLVAVFNRIFRDKADRDLPHLEDYRDRVDLKTDRLTSAVRLFRWIYGEQGFTSEQYRQQERHYKEALSRTWQRAAAREKFESALSGQTPVEELAETLASVLIDPKQSNLLPWRYAGVLKAPWSRERAQAFVGATHRLLYGSERNAPSIDDFNEAMQPFYLETIGSDAIKPASHCIPSLMLWLSDPVSQFFLRPDLYNNATRALVGDVAEGQGSIMTTAYYVAAVRFARTLAQELAAAGLDPLDMIDVQGFLWGIFSRSRIWFGGFSFGRTNDMLPAFVDRQRYAIGRARIPEAREAFENLSRTNPEERKQRRSSLEEMVEDAGDRRALTALFDLVTRPGSLLIAKSVWFDRNTQRSLLRVKGIAITGANYTFDTELGHQTDASWLSQPEEAFVLPGSLFPKVNSTLAQLTIGEALDALGVIAPDEPLIDERGYVEPPEDPPPPLEPPLERSPYSVEQALAEVFMPREDFERALAIWRAKRNLILQGAPGVGKSFLARRLAYALIGYRDPSRVQMVQFHQSYSYEDFVQGFRPKDEGGFELRDGIFLRFCKRAHKDPGENYVFIIDEINRGNLSKILGELMLLIEADKRSDEWAARLAYSRSDEEPFFIPNNVWVLGLMNTADRSLAVVDYALRRRFAFVTAKPAFQSEAFSSNLKAAGVSTELIELIRERMTELNSAIAGDRTNLGPGFCIGHSFFTIANGAEPPTEDWYRSIVETEIAPLIEEYWFDDQAKAEEWRNRLLA